MRVRVAFDLSQEHVAQMDRLVSEAGMSSRAELLRACLRVYGYFLSQERDGKEVVVRKPGGPETSVQFLHLPVATLHNNP